VKTTLEIPDALFRKAKSTAAQHGQTLKQFFTDAVREKLADTGGVKTATPPWMRFFGAGKKYGDSIREIDREIEQVFEQVARRPL
jgi:hypothetical protein